MFNLKVGGCVVLYNPDEAVLTNIETYRDKLDLLVVVDNSDKPNINIIKQLEELDNVIVLSMHGNQGIASALNRGCSYLAEHDYDVCLTMDSDSQFPYEDYDQIMSIISSKLQSDYGLVGLNFNYFSAEKTDTIIDDKCWLTSGNFVNLNAFKQVGGFKDDLFIDYVDFDFDHSLIKHGYKVGYLRDYSLKHTIGNPITKKFFGRTVTSMNHSPIRYYYRYRNSMYLYKTDKPYYRVKYFKELFFNIPKMLLWENDKKAKLRMIAKGRQDSKAGKLGKYEGEV